MIRRIRRVIFDSIEDENDLTQDHRIWLLHTLETLSVTMYIRKSLEEISNEYEINEVTHLGFSNIVDYVFENFIK